MIVRGDRTIREEIEEVGVLGWRESTTIQTNNI